MNRRSQIFGKTLFVDLMMSTLVIVTALLIASNAADKEASQPKVEEHIASEGKYVIIMTWPDKSPDDLDLHVMSPNGHDIFWRNRESDLMHLDHDDLGVRGDHVALAGGGEISTDKNEERTTIRGIIPGEYTVNVHMYSKSSHDEVPVTVVLYRLVGKDTEVVRKIRVLKDAHEEQTAFRFTLHEDESVSDINELPQTFIQPLETAPTDDAM